MKTRSGSNIVAIGRVGSAAGLRGEFRVNLYAADSGNLKEGKHLLFRHFEESAGISGICRTVRYQNGKPVVKVGGVDDREAAESLRGMEVCIDEKDLEPLPDGEHYVRNLLGCNVVDTAGGIRNDVGILKDVIRNTAQSVLEVETPEGRIVLIPAVDAFIRSIDEDARLIEVELIPGFL